MNQENSYENQDVHQGLEPGVNENFFEAVYQEGTPPWDVGHEQPVFVCLAEGGEIRGSVLDVGCGTGENVLYLAGLGHEAWGIDAAPTAIAIAREKAQQRGLEATFSVQNALNLGRLGRTFDTVVDSGLFHTFSDAERQCFVESLATVLRPGGTYFMLCFSDRQPGNWGPRRVTQAEIRDSFQECWRVNYIREARFDTRGGQEGIYAWLSSITRLP